MKLTEEQIEQVRDDAIAGKLGRVVELCDAALEGNEQALGALEKLWDSRPSNNDVERFG